MSRRFGLGLILSALAWTTPAPAHSPIMGIGGVPGGALHAVLIPEHGLGLLALGLVLGQQAWPRRRVGLLIFVSVLTCGLVAAAFAIGESLAADVLLTATGVLGLLIAAAWVPPILGWGLAAVAGMTFALDSRPEVTTTGEAVQMLIGSGFTAVVIVAAIAELSFRLRGTAQVVSRVLGSWIAAIAILVLSLRIVTQMTVG
jgi:hydrogenase/urease accessory protein HupE